MCSNSAQEGEEETRNGEREAPPPAPREVREKEAAAVRAAEEGRLDEALQLLDDAVAMAPDSASVYNNRAQVFDTHTQSLLLPSVRF